MNCSLRALDLKSSAVQALCRALFKARNRGWQELIPILTIAKQMSKPLLIIAESIEKEAERSDMMGCWKLTADTWASSENA